MHASVACPGEAPIAPIDKPEMLSPYSLTVPADKSLFVTVAVRSIPLAATVRAAVGVAAIIYPALDVITDEIEWLDAVADTSHTY